MKRDFRKIYGDQKPISIMKIGKEILMNSPTVAGAVASHKKMQSSLAIVGFGVVGLFTIHQFTKR